MTQSTDQQQERQKRETGLTSWFSERHQIPQALVLPTLKATAFSQREGVTITREEMIALLVVARTYDLNPFTREIYAFEDRSSRNIIPVVSIDGWVSLGNRHDQNNGWTQTFSENFITMDEHCRPAPEWIETSVYRKDREHPVVVREYLDEVYVPPKQRRDGHGLFMGPWQTHTKRMLRHKGLMQALRVAFGFSGIYDEDEAGRIIEGQVVAREFDREEDPGAALAERLKRQQSGAGAESDPSETGEKASESAQEPSEGAPAPDAAPEGAASAPAPAAEPEGQEQAAEGEPEGAPDNKGVEFTPQDLAESIAEAETDEDFEMATYYIERLPRKGDRTRLLRKLVRRKEQIAKQKPKEQEKSDG